MDLPEELLDRLRRRAREKTDLGISAARLIREERSRRERGDD
ncbi:hypothetical protein [Candidatus Palauibacter sp.]